MMVFHGEPFQKGYGLGSFFKSLARKALPLLQEGAKTAGKAALSTGANIARDVLAGNNLKDSAKARLQQTAQTMKKRAFDKITSQVGSGRSKRKKSLKPRTSQKKITLPPACKAKRAKIVPASEDIFGR